MKAQGSRFKMRGSQETGGWRVETRPPSVHASRLTLHASKGFTLLEVMVALAILGLGIVTVLELFSGSLHIGVKASRHTQAAIYAQNIMDQLFARTTLEDGEDGGEFPGGYTWRARIQEIHPDEDRARLQPDRPSQTDLFHLKKIEVQIRWDENGGAKAFTLYSLRTQTEQQNNVRSLSN
jgi:general secretion pathway protein I